MRGTGQAEPDCRLSAGGSDAHCRKDFFQGSCPVQVPKEQPETPLLMAGKILTSRRLPGRNRPGFPRRLSRRERKPAKRRACFPRISKSLTGCCLAGENEAGFQEKNDSSSSSPHPAPGSMTEPVPTKGRPAPLAGFRRQTSCLQSRRASCSPQKTASRSPGRCLC